MSLLHFCLTLILYFQQLECATILLDNTTDSYVWDLEILLFAEPPGPFSMDSGGTVSIDITSSQFIQETPTKTQQICPHISSPHYLEIYVLSEEEFEMIKSDEDYTVDNCYDEVYVDQQPQHCWYYTKATKKFFIPINDTLHTINTIPDSSKYRILLVNPCKVKYSITGKIMLKNPWTSFEHLDVSDRWHPQIVLIAMFFYIFGLIVWSIYLYFNQKYILIHHKLLTLLLMVRGLDYCIFYISFVVYNIDGISTNYDLLFYEILNSIFEVIGFFFLLIVSMGYLLYRPTLNVKQMKVAVGSIVLYGLICILDETCFLFQEYCHFIELFQFILRCFLLVGIVALLNALISSVHAVIRQEQWRLELKHSYLLLKSHKILRWAFYVYVIGPITVYILYLSIFHWTEEWLYYMINCDIIEPALLAYIYYHFRPSPYFVHVVGIF